MQIGHLEQHCGKCPLIDYCAEPYEDLCLCTDSRLKYTDTEQYKELAKKVSGTNEEICESVVKMLSQGAYQKGE